MKLNHLTKVESHVFILKFVFVLSIFSIVSQNSLEAQENTYNKAISTFQDYSAGYREVAYCHLNKSIFVKGEMLGFSGYVLNKGLKIPSLLTKNLYCVITDSTNKVVKSKLVKVDNGFTNNIFNLDSLFTSGNYTFKAYTNWMKNFDERNAFVESFKVIDPEKEKVIKRKLRENVIDAQFLPEGGHFVSLVKTTVGVVIKDSDGYGLPNVEGTVFNQKNEVITAFKTNSLGIGRFLLTPIIGDKYTVEVGNLDKTFRFLIDDIKAKGVSVSVNDIKGKIALEFKTNKRTLNDIKGKQFKLTFHNGKNIKSIDVEFNTNNPVKTIEYDELFSGINIFTLFNEDNNPVLERLFFNFRGVNFLSLDNPSLVKSKDSLTITVPLKNINSIGKKSNISVSVLPQDTKSYNRNHNIISSTLLQPYVKGYIENAQHYFTNINRRKKYDLDNLLITQGWSSYNWGDIFNGNSANSFVFEDGIVIQANKNNNEANNLILYPLENNEGFLVDLPANEKSFIKSGFYPIENEALSVGILGKKGITGAANLYMQFSPSKIPEFKQDLKTLKHKELTYFNPDESKPFYLLSIENMQELEKVLIETNIRQTRIEKLKGSSSMRVDVFDDSKRARNLTLPNYLTSQGFFASEQGGRLTIKGTNAQSFEADNSGVVVYLNDLRLSSYEFLLNFDMSTVDYIATNRYGIGEGMRGGNNGVIKIYTSNMFEKKNQKKSLRKFEFPLTFSKIKKFYAPKYSSYNDDFFNEYGVIDWIPNCKIDANNNLNITVYNPNNVGLKLFIEGITEQGGFIAETKTIKHNN